MKIINFLILFTLCWIFKLLFLAFESNPLLRNRGLTEAFVDWWIIIVMVVASIALVLTLTNKWRKQ